jgi:replicative DNA helicase
MNETFFDDDSQPTLPDLLSTPPHDLQLEQAVLGAILLNPDWFPELLHLQTVCFYREAHRILFEAMKTLFGAGIPLDNVSVATHLIENGLIQTVTNTYILELMTSQPSDCFVTLSSLQHWVSKLAMLAERREALKLAYSLAETACDLSNSAYLPEALNDLQTLSCAFLPEQETNLAPSLEIASLAIQNKALSNHPLGIPSGLKKLDALTHGLQGGQLAILAARPGSGKTAMALNMALHAALEAKRPVLLFSLEMSASELLERALKSVGDTSFDAQKLAMAKAKILESQDRFKIIDSPNQGVPDIVAAAHRWHKKTGGHGLIVVDHLALIAQPESRFQNRNLELEKSSWALKALSKTLGVPVLLLCQLNRAVETRQDKRPLLSDLRDSGGIEQNADIVMFIHGDDPINKTLTIAKHRNGPLGEVPLCFIPHLTQFREMPSV